MESAPSYVAGAMLRGDQRRRDLSRFVKQIDGKYSIQKDAITLDEYNVICIFFVGEYIQIKNYLMLKITIFMYSLETTCLRMMLKLSKHDSVTMS